MAVNKSPWVRNLDGDIKPLRILMPVDAGSSYAIKRGEICKVGKNTAGRPGPVASSSDKTMLVISDQEQKADDSARMIPFIIPRPGDVFEFALAASRAVVIGDPFEISTSQILAYDVASANVVARVAGDENCPQPEEKSVTRRTLTHARFVFDETASYFSELSGNS